MVSESKPCQRAMVRGLRLGLLLEQTLSESHGERSEAGSVTGANPVREPEAGSVMEQTLSESHGKGRV